MITREEHRQTLVKLEEKLLQERNDFSEKFKLETENLLQQEKTTILREREIALKELSTRLEQETRMVSNSSCLDCKCILLSSSLGLLLNEMVTPFFSCTREYPFQPMKS